MIKKKLSKVLTVLSTVCALTLACNCIIFAAQAESPYSYSTVGNYVYKYNSTVVNNSSSTWAYTDAENTGTAQIPAGYIGIQPRLYASNGSLKLSGYWSYNNSPIVGTDICTESYNVKGSYYSCGQVSFYNGNGYNTYVSNKSPNLSNLSSALQEDLKNVSKYQVNKNGETYGSALLAGTLGNDPDLIEACGIDGTTGYIKSSDLNSTPKTPKEALEEQKNNTVPKIIPLYDQDGEKIIGQFQISLVKVTYKITQENK